MDRPPSWRLKLLSTIAATAIAGNAAQATGALPERLRDTGLYAATGRAPDTKLHSFSPQYPLWSDGTDKRRWVHLPPGTAIDASDPDAWVFPRGTRFWKEFALDGRLLETRYIEYQADGTWRFATYIWDETGADAVLAPTRGATLTGVFGLPRGRYLVPSRGDCMVCHGSARVPVLGFSALQLSPDRDPNVANARPLPHGDLDLRGLLTRGLLRNLPAALVDKPPRIPSSSPIERAALGTLHGNCAHCHNTSENRAPLTLTLEQGAADPITRHAEVLRTMIGAPSRWRPPGAEDESDADSRVVVPGRPEASALVRRMQSRHAATQMPPLGTQLPDTASLELIHRWITHDLTKSGKETRP